MQSDTVFVTDTALETNSQLNIPSSPRLWQSWTVTDIGKHRERNEDAVLSKPEAGLWAIADGMGGHECGDIASQLVVESLDSILLTADLEMTLKKVDDCLQIVNTQLRDLAKQRRIYDIIGSTVVVFIAQQQRCAVLWAGDSRLYRLRNNQLQQLTEDHCPDYENTLADEWAVKLSNEITRAVGADQELELDCKITDVCEGDLFLLCSDGLDKEISSKEIEQILLNQPLAEIVDALLELALQRGAQDNVSIILAVPVKIA